MPRLRKPAVPAATPAVSPAAATDDIVQVKVWLLGVSPMVWRRVLVPASFTLRELHGVIQVAMGWEAIHLYQFSLRAVRYGSSELASSSPDVSLAALRLRKGSRFLYEYDLNIAWRHGVRIEDRLARQTNMTYPSCTGGSGTCPPEDCHDPARFMDGSVHGWSWEALEDLGTMVEIIHPIVLERRPEILDDDETRWRLENALDRTRSRERAKGKPF
jgi:Plasmid pRiA4b ORF-3-like protein